MRPWQRPWFGPLVALVALAVTFVAIKPDTFATTANLVAMTRQTIVVSIAAVGMTLVIIQGGIDLSVGSAVALTTVVVAARLKAGESTAVAIADGVVTVGATGMVTGALVAGLRVPPFIVTLGTMSLLRGIAKGIAHEQKIDVDARGLDALVAPPKSVWALFPPGVWIALALAALAAAMLRYTRLGRHIFAIGSSEPAARIAGVDVELTKIAVYSIAGLLAGLAGLMEFANLTVGDPTDSVGLELSVIAAVVIGGASLSGGQGSILGALIGAFLMTVIKTGCTHVGWPNWVEECVTGAIILVAVSIDQMRQRTR